MKTQQINQLAQWTERRRFEDFLFVLGLRRRGSRFEPEHGFNQALFEDQSGSLVGGDGGDGGDDPNHTRETYRPCRRYQCLVLLPPTSNLINCTSIPTQNGQFAKTRAERRRTQIPQFDPATVATNSRR
jgi:hypothetical protein